MFSMFLFLIFHLMFIHFLLNAVCACVSFFFHQESFFTELSSKFHILDFGEQCRYVGNIHTQVTEPLLQEVFASTGPLEGCKLIRKEKVNFNCTNS